MLPKWVQEVKDRADKATEGPWRIGLGSGHNVCTGIFTEGDEPKWIADCLSDDMLNSKMKLSRSHVPNMNFIAESRTDIPKLIETAAELARALELVGAVLACARVNDTLISDNALRDRAYRAFVGMIQALRNWKEGKL